MIKAPPRRVPDHLQPHDYCRLAIQYYLMGWTRQSVKAGRLALQTKPNDLAGTPFGELSEEDFARFRRMIEGLDTSVSIGEQVLGVAKSFVDFVQDGVDSSSKVADDLVKDNQVLRLLKFGFEESVRTITTGMQDALNMAVDEAVKVTQPPRTVPDNLTPQGYLDLAKQYLSYGWTEQARDSLLKVRELEGDKLKGALAWTLLKTQLPKEPLPYLAEEGLAEARRKIARGQLMEARFVLEELISRYPEIEVLYCLLAHCESSAGRLEQANNYLNKAVELNPNHLNTWLQLARVHAIGGSVLEAQRCLDRATDLDPDDFSIPHYRQIISVLSRL
ncbi:MAG: tetratricopeptide repeat protein [Candidatus Obscuribacterales bacterium]|nr:tetratricopeptide repeat protein [Candidatus Obscuribacterales bacterium]